MTEFEGVHPALGQALEKRGYSTLTPVQTAVLAPELEGADALVSAQTGSGKTVAFGLAMASTLLGDETRFARADTPLALAVAPTRELALQVQRELEWLYAETGALVASCVGGMDMRTERRALERGAHIVVGTPGRLRDHIERGSLDPSAMQAVVLDEADEMLDLGFREDLEFILDTTPEDRRTLLFSATVPRSIQTLAKRYQRDAVRVTTAAEQKQHLDIEYRALTVAPNDRENAVINLLRFYEPRTAIIFCATRATVNHMTSRFNNRGFSVVALSGELSQSQRSHALQALRDGRAQVCIATDVAARGIDIPDLELVVHADIPKSPEPLLHRSGRTGRAGRKGVSALIVPYNARRRTERLLQNAKVEADWGRPPSVEEILERDRARFLADPALSEPVAEEEKAFIAELLSTHGAEQIAAALIRQHQTGRPAPEELLDAGLREPREPREPRDRKQKNRQDFEDGQWITLSIGRRQNAEPRWLLPMLCRNGHVTKKEIGSIRIRDGETHVELAPKAIARFMEAIGPEAMIEKTIRVSPMKGQPAAESSGPRARPAGQKRPRVAETPEGEERKERRAKPQPKKPRKAKSRKDKGKPDFKEKKRRAKRDGAAPENTGGQPLKRKRPE